jgi:hypothetical protein
MHQYNIREPFKGITIDIRGPLPESEKGKSIPPDCCGLLH